MLAAVISGNRLTDSEAKAKRSEAASASPLGLCLFCGRLPAPQILERSCRG